MEPMTPQEMLIRARHALEEGSGKWGEVDHRRHDPSHVAARTASAATEAALRAVYHAWKATRR